MPSLMSGAAGSQSRVTSGLAVGAPVLVAPVTPAAIRPTAPSLGPTAGRFTKFIGPGVTKDNSGAPLAGVTCTTFRSSTQTVVDTRTSDAAGGFSVPVYDDDLYRIDGYLSGSPDVAGTTLNTLQGK